MFWIFFSVLFLGILYFFHQIEGFENDALTLEEFNLKYEADIVLLPTGLFALGVEKDRYDTIFTFVNDEEMILDYWMKYIHPSLPSKYFVILCPMNVFDYSGNILEELSVRPVIQESLQGIDSSLFVSKEISEYPFVESKRKVYALCKNIHDKTTVLLPDKDFIREHAYEDLLKKVDKHRVDYSKKYTQCIWVGDLTDVSEDTRIDSRSKFKKLYEEGQFSNVNFKKDLKIDEQMKYKMMLDMDEMYIRSTAIWKLYSGSVLLKTRSNWKQWYDLIEWEHYVPIKDDFSDLNEKIEWCLQHEEECEEMIKNAKTFVIGTLNWEQVNKDIVEDVLDSFRSFRSFD